MGLGGWGDEEVVAGWDGISIYVCYEVGERTGNLAGIDGGCMDEHTTGNSRHRRGDALKHWVEI